jgi:hypothetical protein
MTSPDEIDALVASGATGEMIAAMFKANLAEQEKARAKRRAGAKARQDRHREREKLTKQRRPERDLVDEMQSPIGEQQYIDAAIAGEASRMSRVTGVTERDKRNPHKENTSSLRSEVSSDTPNGVSATADAAPPADEKIDLRPPIAANEDPRTRLWREGTGALD